MSKHYYNKNRGSYYDEDRGRSRSGADHSRRWNQDDRRTSDESSSRGDSSRGRSDRDGSNRDGSNHRSRHRDSPKSDQGSRRSGWDGGRSDHGRSDRRDETRQRSNQGSSNHGGSKPKPEVKRGERENELRRPPTPSPPARAAPAPVDPFENHRNEVHPLTLNGCDPGALARTVADYKKNGGRKSQVPAEEVERFAQSMREDRAKKEEEKRRAAAATSEFGSSGSGKSDRDESTSRKRDHEVKREAEVNREDRENTDRGSRGSSDRDVSSGKRDHQVKNEQQENDSEDDLRSEVLDFKVHILPSQPPQQVCQQPPLQAAQVLLPLQDPRLRQKSPLENLPPPQQLLLQYPRLRQQSPPKDTRGKYDSLKTRHPGHDWKPEEMRQCSEKVKIPLTFAQIKAQEKAEEEEREAKRKAEDEDFKKRMEILRTTRMESLSNTFKNKAAPREEVPRQEDISEMRVAQVVQEPPVQAPTPVTEEVAPLQLQRAVEMEKEAENPETETIANLPQFTEIRSNQRPPTPPETKADDEELVPGDDKAKDVEMEENRKKASKAETMEKFSEEKMKAALDSIDKVDSESINRRIDCYAMLLTKAIKKKKELTGQNEGLSPQIAELLKSAGVPMPSNDVEPAVQEPSPAPVDNEVEMANDTPSSQVEDTEQTSAATPPLALPVARALTARAFASPNARAPPAVHPAPAPPVVHQPPALPAANPAPVPPAAPQALAPPVVNQPPVLPAANLAPVLPAAPPARARAPPAPVAPLLALAAAGRPARQRHQRVIAEAHPHTAKEESEAKQAAGMESRKRFKGDMKEMVEAKKARKGSQIKKD